MARGGVVTRGDNGRRVPDRWRGVSKHPEVSFIQWDLSQARGTTMRGQMRRDVTNLQSESKSWLLLTLSVLVV